MRFCLAIILVVCVALHAPAKARYDIVVAKDGSGMYTTLQQAIHAVPSYTKKRISIFIKKGTY